MFTGSVQTALSGIEGIDWITVTAKTTMKTFDEMWTLAYWAHPKTKKERKDWRFFGYQGHSIGDFSFGTRENEAIMQFRGNLATEGITQIPDGWKCTRIDLQTSVFLETELELAKTYFQSLGGSNRTARPTIRFVSSSHDRGDTLYVGSRASEQMGRVYDKGAERRVKADGEIGSRIFWRYEVELKAAKAREVYNALWFEKGGFKTQIVCFVYDWFVERGIVPVYERAGVNLVVQAAVNQATEADEYKRKLQWLVRTAAPVVKTLREEYSPYTILEALNLVD